jgi:hypothetical protein
MLRSSLLIAADAGGVLGAALGHVGVVTGVVEDCAEGELLLVQPTTADRTTPDKTAAASFTPPRYVTGNDTICS